MHFACTSEDINNLAYALMLKSARGTVLLPALEAIGAQLDSLAERHASVGMLARTHGQTATPTTVGKEIANVAARLRGQRSGLERVVILGKMNGAVGNFNAHVAALPHIDWPQFSARFVESLGLQPNAYTTQIEPHDWIAEYCHALMRANTVLLDFARDMWSLHLARLFQAKARWPAKSAPPPCRTRSIPSTSRMPKAIWGSRMRCSPTSRTSCRSRGCSATSPTRPCCAISAWRSVTPPSPISRSRPVCRKSNSTRPGFAEDLDRAWEVLGEAVQTVMRAHGIPDAYDRLKSFTRGRPIDQAAMREFIDSLRLPAADKERLLELAPRTYLGLAPALARRAP